MTNQGRVIALSDGTGIKGILTPARRGRQLNGLYSMAPEVNSIFQKFGPTSTEGSNGTTVAGVTGSFGDASNLLNAPYDVAVDGVGFIAATTPTKRSNYACQYS